MTGSSPALHWLPAEPDWRSRLRELRRSGSGGADDWLALVALARTRLDFPGVGALDQVAREIFPRALEGLARRPVRLAILASATVSHLLPSIRVAGMRRGLWVDIHEGGFGQYFQELSDPGSALHRFAPDVVLFAMDADHLTRGAGDAGGEAPAEAAVERAGEHLAACWRLAGRFGAQLVQQTALDVFPAVLGENEHRLGASRAEAVHRLNAWLRRHAAAARVDLLALDRRAARDGLASWFNPALWYRGKQEIAHAAAPMYGDLVMRLVAARLGLSAKCLVLDLDNTLWGGVIGDDGMEGVILGQGSAAGEAFQAVQGYAQALARRGIILAVNSKNDAAVAKKMFFEHPEMVLRPDDIACFVANWEDKASNLRHIAQELSIGLDALVFLDDNPAERALVRRELADVAVPEVPEDPALVPAALADAGYFESLAVTAEDLGRAGLYAQTAQRRELQASATDMAGFLRDLDMVLSWRRFDAAGLPRIVQLINKTNQFNLTTRRMTQPEVEAIMADSRQVGLQLRLRDRFGDNGIIAIVIGILDEVGGLVLDTWLMSCRVLGRQVEEATLNLIADVAATMGARRLVGVYRPTARNTMVKDLYARLGFALIHEDDGGSRHGLDLAEFRPTATTISIRQG